MASINGMDPAGHPHPGLAATPNRERFRLRVEVYLPQDAHSYNAKPYHSFIIAKSKSLNLPELSLRELRDTVVYRYKTIYPNETLFQISKTTNALGDDLFLDDSVGDIFADNEVFRVIKGASIRESLPRNYRESREASLQPSHNTTRKRSPNTSNIGDLTRAGKRPRFHEPERAIPSIERFAAIDEEDEASSQEELAQAPEEQEQDGHDEDEPHTEDADAPTGNNVNGTNVSGQGAGLATAQPAIIPRTSGRVRQPPPAYEPAPAQPPQSAAKQTGEPVVKRRPGRPRKSLDAVASAAAPKSSPEEPRRTVVSTSPMLPPVSATAKKSASQTQAESGFEALKALGNPAKNSQMLPPPTISQRKPAAPLSLPSTSKTDPKPALTSSPASSDALNGVPSTKKGRRVSFVEPSPPALGALVADASGAQSQKASAAVTGSALESAQSSQATTSAETATDDESVLERSKKDEERSMLQDPNFVATVSPKGPYKRAAILKANEANEKVRLAKEELEKRDHEAKMAKKQAAAEKKLAAEKKKSDKKAAQEQKAKAKADAKEAKHKERAERKLAKSSQKTCANASGNSPAVSASAKISMPTTDENGDTAMSDVNQAASLPTPGQALTPASIPAPPSSPVMPTETPKQATGASNQDISPSEASSPDSVSTSRSQRNSRSPVHFVTAPPKIASKDSFPGSAQKQENGDQSDSSEDSSSEEEDDNLDTASAVKPKTPAQSMKDKADAASTQSLRSTSYIPPPSQPRLSGFGAAIKDNRRMSTTPIQPPVAKFAKDSNLPQAAPRAADSPAPSQSQRPAAMAHLPSLKTRAAEAVANRAAEMERIRVMGITKSKELHDKQIAKSKEEKVEESEAETESSSGGSDSDSDSDSSDSDATKSAPKNKLLMGLNGGTAPASASKAEGRRKRKKQINFAGIKKRFSLGSSLK